MAWRHGAFPPDFLAKLCDFAEKLCLESKPFLLQTFRGYVKFPGSTSLASEPKCHPTTPSIRWEISCGLPRKSVLKKHETLSWLPSSPFSVRLPWHKCLAYSPHPGFQGFQSPPGWHETLGSGIPYVKPLTTTIASWMGGLDPTKINKSALFVNIINPVPHQAAKIQSLKLRGSCGSSASGNSWPPRTWAVETKPWHEPWNHEILIG